MPKILVIEDDSSLLENTCEFLELEGYKVSTATNGKNGLSQIFESVPDLIICDLLMPEMDGIELLGTLGKHAEYKAIPLIFLSAKTEKIDIRNGLEAGAAGYIAKPFELDDLLLTIERCLTERKYSKKI
ncbi:MAG TPA: response regulator [Pricia sp.]|nr:response regulator [Pricia sp.]